MVNKYLIAVLMALMLCSTVFALAPALTAVSPTTGSIITGGVATDVNVTVVDYNTVSAITQPQTISVYYSTVAGGFQNLVILDSNLQDGSRFVCDDYNFYDATTCMYQWTVPIATTLAAGTYYLDYNFGDFNGVAAAYNYRTSSSGAFSVTQTMAYNSGAGTCSMFNIIPFALLAGLVVMFIIGLVRMKSGESSIQAAIESIVSFIAVFIIVIVIFTLVGLVCI